MRAEPMSAAVAMIVTSPVINQDTEEQFRATAIRRLVWKLDRRLIPFLILLEISAYINRLSIGHAKLMGIEKNLNMLSGASDWADSIFFLAYLIFEIPSNIFLRFFGPTRFLSLNMLAWGTIAIGMAFVTNARELLIVRFLLGMAESGFFPGIIIYFSLWYCKKEQTMRIAILFGSGIASGALGGVLAYGIRQMECIGGLHNWQWLFLLEGLPMIPLGVITYLFLGNIPDTVQWLDNCEKQILTNFLRDDAGPANSESASSTRLSWRQVRYVFVDWRIYLYAVILVGDMTVNKFLITYLALLVKEMGYLYAEAHLMVAPPYAVGCICILLAGYSSSCRNEHGFHLAFCLSISLFGFILMLSLFDQGTAVLYVSTCIACCGTFSAFPLVLSWLTNNVGGYTKRAMAVSVVLGMDQIGGVLGPQVYRDVDKPTYRRGHIICSGMVTVILIVTFILRICLKLENHRRIHLSPDEHDREAATKEPCDWHPDIRYVL